MIEQNKIPTLCRNGHQLPVSDSKFCIYCGVSLNAQPPQPPLPPVQPPNMPSPQQQFQPPANPQFYQQQQTPPQYPPNAQYGQPFSIQPQVQPVQPIVCRTCGGKGQGLDEKIIVCKECRWLRPLAPGYGIECSAFQWAEDGKAMSALRSVTPLNAAAKTISEKVGRRWIEVTFNGVRLSERQMPEIYSQAVRAARILGMSHMPDVYLSGEQAWDCQTFGSDKDSFVVIGSALVGNFRGDEILFLLAREMGHCRAGHALWKTVIRFFLGEQGPRKGLMAGGIFAALSPSALIGGAIEMPLLAWARQAEITADRAGLLAVGNEEIARKVLLSWSLKSAFIYRQINVEAWLEQQAADDDDTMRLSELTTTSTPYITRRLKLINQFSNSPDLQRWRNLINNFVKSAEPKPAAKPGAADNDLKIKCSDCQTPMRVPLKVLEGKQQLAIRCPNEKCKKITTIKKSIKSSSAAGQAPMPNKQERNLNYDD